MARAPTEIRSLARSHTKIAIKVLAGIAKDGTNDAARVAAACALLDRGWGKPPQTHTGPDGEADIQVTIWHLVEGMPDERRVIEIAPAEVIDAEPRCAARRAGDILDSPGAPGRQLERIGGPAAKRKKAAY
jgi:hypothetical protein